MANPWDNDPIVEEENTSENPWDNDPELSLPADPEQGMDLNTYINKLDNPEKLQTEIDANNDQRSLQTGGPVNKDDLLFSKDELYQDVEDRIARDPKFDPLREYEGSLLYHGGVQTPWGHFSTRGKTPPEIEALKKERDTLLQQQYEQWGQEESFKIPEAVPLVGGMDTGLTYRSQEVMKNNPEFDPSKDESSDNPAMVREKYILDPPDSDAATRIAYQVMKNIVGGVGDVATEGKFLQPGEFSKSMPDTVPNSPAEDFTSELTTFIVGPKLAEVAIGAAAKGTGLAGKAAGGALISKIASTMTPEDIQAVRTVYQNTLQKTKNANKAYAAANTVVKRMTVGAAFGLKGAGYGVIDAAVAPNGAEPSGLGPDPETIQKAFPNFSKEQAADAAYILETPLIMGTLNVLGRTYDMASNMVKNQIGGLRNLQVLGVNVGNNKFTMSEKDAGLNTFLWIDEPASTSTPKELAFRMKVFGDALERNAVKQLQIGQVKGDIKMDTPSAFLDAARDYYRIAYKGHMGMEGKEFNDWVSEQANRTANKLLELRTSIIGDSEYLTKNSAGAKGVENFLDTAADAKAGGSLVEAQQKAGQTITDIKTTRDAQIEGNLETAKQEALSARTAADEAINNNPEIKKLMDEAESSFGIGAKEKEFQLLRGMSEKTYNSLKKMKTEVDSAYDSVAKSGADGDPSSIMQIIKDAGYEEDEFFKKIAEDVNKDPSFNNMYNRIRNRLSGEISSATTNNDLRRRETLLELKNNISDYQLDWLKSNGDGDVVEMVDDAKQKYIQYRTAWRDNNSLERVTEAGEARIRGEKMPSGVGPGQGITDFRTESMRFIDSSLSGPVGQELRESLQRAVKAGGGSIDQDIADYYATKAFGDMADKLVRGGKQNINTLRQAVKGYADGLIATNKPLANKLKQLEVDIQTIENTAGSKEEAYKALQEKTAELRKLSQQSVLEKFIYTRSLDGVKVPKEDTGGVLKKIYNSPEATERVQELYDEAGKLIAAGDKNGEVIKQAIKGTYIDHLTDSLISRRPMGITGVDSAGRIETGFKANEAKFDKIFDPRSKDMKLLKKIFSDEPEVAEALEDAASMYVGLTKSSPQARGDVLGRLPKSQDPMSAVQSIIYVVAGPLSRPGTIARKLTGPMAIESLDQVVQARQQTVITMIREPQEFAKFLKDYSKGMSDEEVWGTWKELRNRALARTVVSDETDKPEYYKPKEDVKVPVGVR